MTQPNMTKEFKRELRRLKAQVKKIEKEETRANKQFRRELDRCCVQKSKLNRRIQILEGRLSS